MKLGSLFSGAGLGDLGWLMSGMNIRWQCEIDEYCQKVLELRFPETKKYRDVRGLINEELEPVDIVAGGFPCQPFSVAGKQRSDQDDRNLWPKMFEVIKKVRPTYVVGENVSGIIPLYLDTVLSDLESAGYSCRTFVFPAHAIGASHRRERIWIVGYSDNARSGVRMRDNRNWEKKTKNGGRVKRSEFSETSQNVANTELRGCIHGQIEKQPAEGRIDAQCEPKPSGADVADSKSKGRKLWSKRNKEPRTQFEERLFRSDGSGIFACWGREFESGVGRTTNVRANRVDRLKAIGNGQVVACTAFIGQLIMEFERLK